MRFSTHDYDNDQSGGSNCAKSYGGGWWFNDCGNSCLNGPYMANYSRVWNTSDNNLPTFKIIEMKIKLMN